MKPSNTKFPEKLKLCSICREERYIGFINYYTKEKYRLCRRHYLNFMYESKGVSLPMYIKFSKANAVANQSQLGEFKDDNTKN